MKEFHSAGRAAHPTWLLATVAWIAVIFFSSTNLAEQWSEQAFRYLSGQILPAMNPGPLGIMHLVADKGLHVTMFCVLAVLLYLAVPAMRQKTVLILLAGFLVGSASEFLQRFFPGRDPALRDVLINTAGTALGLSFCLLAVRLLPQTSSVRSSS
jgi:VanZ family protein